MGNIQPTGRRVKSGKRTTLHAVPTLTADTHVGADRHAVGMLRKTIDKQRVSLEFIARNFDDFSEGSLDSEAQNILAAIVSLLGTFRELDDAILSLESGLRHRAKLEGGAS